MRCKSWKGSVCCGGQLRDNTLDWDDALPELELGRTEEHCAHAQLAIVLGSSLRIEPAASMCVSTATEYAKQVTIVNLQQTPKDEVATLRIHAKCDEVMRLVMEELGVPIPCFKRCHSIQGNIDLIPSKDGEKRSEIICRISGNDGRRLPCLQSIIVTASWGDAAVHLETQPFRCKFTLPQDEGQLTLQLKWHPVLVVAGAPLQTEILWNLANLMQVSSELKSSRSYSTEWQIESMQRDYASYEQ